MNDFSVYFDAPRPNFYQCVCKAGYHNYLYNYTDILIRKRLNKIHEILYLTKQL